MKAELGSVNPYIVTPGEWTDAEIDAHANMLVSAKMLNNGHICASPQVVVTCKNWPLREKFLSRVRDVLKTYPGTRPYYPNCERQYSSQLTALAKEKKKEESELVVKTPQLFENQQFPIFVTDIDAASYACREEAFTPVLTELPLDTKSTASDFLPEAVKFINSGGLWGSLSGTLIVDDRTSRDEAKVVDKAIDDLEIGGLGVNYWGGAITVFPQGTWGAYPKHKPEDIQSGVGYIGNTFCFTRPVKTVLRAPFTYPGQFRVPSTPAEQFTSLTTSRRMSAFITSNTGWNLFKFVAGVVSGL